MSESVKRILVVDDEAGFARLLKLGLERTGRYDVRVENRARVALDSAREFEPHLILLDCLMPENGRARGGGPPAGGREGEAHPDRLPDRPLRALGGRPAAGPREALEPG